MADTNVTDTAVSTHVENVEKAMADEKPKTLRQYETIVEKNAARGASFWRLAADALLQIKTHKLWRKAKDADGDPYPSFAAYAEARFGFKKTYAYDLAKAATRNPEALTEGAARAKDNAERTPQPLASWQAAQRIVSKWDAFLDRAGDIRDRAIDDVKFVNAYDALVKSMGEALHKWADRYPEPIVETAEEISPTRDTAGEAQSA